METRVFIFKILKLDFSNLRIIEVLHNLVILKVLLNIKN
jgi:hypothetical protein